MTDWREPVWSADSALAALAQEKGAFVQDFNDDEGRLVVLVKIFSSKIPTMNSEESVPEILKVYEKAMKAIASLP